jgi:beta-lactamase regulating signal transducer with metallopeptidase domain
MTILMLLLKATVLLVLAAAADRLLARRASGAVRHGLWTLAIVGLLGLPVLTAAIPSAILRLPILPAPEQASSAEQTMPAATASRAQGLPVATAAEMLTPAGPEPIRSPAPAWSWPAIALGVYLAGLLLLLARLVAGHLAAHRIVRRAAAIETAEWRELVADCQARLDVPRRVRLLRAPGPSMPMAVGLRAPVILVPETAEAWTLDRRRAVVLHELAHIARRDCLTQALASVAVALYWFHPGVWWADRRLRAEREFACDDRVLGAGAPARDYAGHLLEIAYAFGAHRAPASVVAMARAGQLEGRLLAVMDAARNRATPGVAWRTAAALVALVLVVPLAAVTPTTRTGPAAPDETVVESGWTPPAAVPFEGAPQTPSEASAPGTSGTWDIQPGNTAGQVQLQLRQGRSSSGRQVPVSSLEGLSPAQMTGTSQVTFSLRRDAGVFHFTGSFRDGAGAGTYTFTPSTTFPAELAARGVGRPTAAEQYELAKHDVGLALVDELRTQAYATPTVADLVTAGHHGVSTTYVRDMGRLGYRVGAVATLVTMRDHGVTPGYVEGLAGAGLPKLEAGALVRARDHGVTPDYVKALAGMGYASLDIDALINARDHGVTADYLTAMSGLGYAKLPLDALVKARDHGITADYVRSMSGLGFAGLPIDTLVRARDHGVTADYAGRLRDLGYKADLEQLVRARDHGITPDYVSGLKALGYDSIPLDDLIMLRDHGVTPDSAKRANDRAGTRLPLDMLRSLADRGQR